jgi:hypothetical protein
MFNRSKTPARVGDSPCSKTDILTFLTIYGILDARMENGLNSTNGRKGEEKAKTSDCTPPPAKTRGNNRWCAHILSVCQGILLYTLIGRQERGIPKMSDTERGNKFMITQNNPQKWLRGEEEDDSPYRGEEWSKYWDSLPAATRDGTKYAHVALERGEEGTYHLQGFLLLKTQQRRSWLYKQFPKADVKVARGTIEQADSYIGNTGFIHADGSTKGGEVFWNWTCGNKPQGRAARAAGEQSPSEKRLDEMKTLIDEHKGKNIIRALWQHDFYMMLRYSRGIKEYISDCFDINMEAIKIADVAALRSDRRAAEDLKALKNRETEMEIRWEDERNRYEKRINEIEEELWWARKSAGQLTGGDE